MQNHNIKSSPFLNNKLILDSSGECSGDYAKHEKEKPKLEPLLGQLRKEAVASN
jgi:hypothetical protein